MGKEKPTAETAAAASPAAAAKPTFLVMRSLLFNPVDQHAYLPAAYTRDNEEGRRDENDQIIQVDIPAHEWVPGTKLEPYTFLLNGKEYEAGFIPDQNPANYEHIEYFPTQSTLDAFMPIVQRTFPGLNFEVVREERTERVYANVVNPVIQGQKDSFVPGAFAIQAMLQGEKVAMEQLAARLRNANVLR